MQAEHRIVCPWCAKGEVYADGRGEVSITVFCPKCRHIFRVNLDDYTVEKTVAKRRVQGCAQPRRYTRVR